MPELALIAGTRGLLGVGIGLLLASKLGHGERRAVGKALTIVGLLTTVPLALEVFGKRASGELPAGV
jgi:hypothetical protein